MNRYTISTDTVPERERIEYWQEMASRTFLELRTEHMARGPAFGRLEHFQVGDVPVTRLHASAQRVYRGRSELSRSSREVYFLCMQVQGVCRVRSVEEERLCKPGDLELIDATQQGDLCFEEDYRRIVLNIPQHLLRPRLNAAWQSRRVLVAPGDRGFGAVASSFVRFFAHCDIQGARLQRMSEMLLETLAYTFDPEERGAEAAPSSLREVLRHRALAYAESHLADPELSPARVARHCKISLRSLHALFAEEEATFMRWVLARRLERCRKDLADPALRSRNISDIAWDWGFRDPTHFSRAFKSAYQMTPREWREQALRRT